jgi:hypothetical protein
VEVPFFPRERRRSRRGFSWRQATVWGGVLIGVLIVGLGIVKAGRAWRSRDAAQRDREVSALVDTAESAERSGQFDIAFQQVCAAIARAETVGGRPYPGLDDLRRRKESLALRDVKQRLEGCAHRAPEAAVAEATALLARLDKDPALARLRPEVLEALERSRMSAAILDLARARQAWNQGNAKAAIEGCERVLGSLRRTSSDQAASLVEEAQSIAVEIASRSGVVLPPVHGSFVLGSSDEYDQLLGSVAAQALHKRGYVVQPRLPVLRATWDKHAPYRATIQVDEREEGHYLQSVYPLIKIDVLLELTRGGAPFWRLPLTTRTRTPIPGLAAYEAGRLATAQKRASDGYKRIYDDSREILREQFPAKLRNMPGPVPPLTH